MGEKLLPCPRCGSDAVPVEFRDSYGVLQSGYNARCGAERCPNSRVQSTPKEWNRRAGISVPPEPAALRAKWRVGRTPGGALGVWSEHCKSDEPDVCHVASVPSHADEKRATLIAAAPCLLKSLIDVCDDANGIGPFKTGVYEQARAVVAKARNESGAE